MSRTRFRQHRRLAALAALQASLIFSAAARAQTDEDESKPPPAETPPAPPSPNVGGAAPAAAVGGVAPVAPAPLWEEMGPDTYPGRLRGLYGGSLWLERSLDGLQWPPNTPTNKGI